MKIVVVLLTALALVAGAPRLDAQRKSTIIERVLVRVNGEIFTQSDLTQQQTDKIQERKSQMQDTSDATVLQMINDVTPDVLVDAIDEILLVQRGHELDLKYSDDEFKRNVDSIKTLNKLDDAQLKKAMEAEGLTMEKLRANFERAWLVKGVQQEEILRRLNVTEEELRQYYSSHKDTFMTPETVTLREILVAGPAAGPAAAGQNLFRPTEDPGAVKAKIDAIRARAVAGEDFVGLVALSDAPTKSTGGLVGPVRLDDISPAVKTLVSTLKPGEISNVLQVPRGYEIFKLESRSEPEPIAFEKVRDEIDSDIRTSRLSGEMAKLLAKLRSQALIEWKDDSLRKIYEKRLVERAQQHPDMENPGAVVNPVAKAVPAKGQPAK